MVSIARVVLVFLMVVLPGLAFAWTSGQGSQEVRLAYLDPGSGSFMIQALVAALAGIAVTGRLYWTKIKSVLGFSSRTDDEDPDDLDE